MNPRTLTVALGATLSVAGCGDRGTTKNEAVETLPTPAPERCTAAPKYLEEPCAELMEAGQSTRCMLGDLLQEADPLLHAELVQYAYGQDYLYSRRNLLFMSDSGAFTDCTPEEKAAIGRRALEEVLDHYGDEATGIVESGTALKEAYEHEAEFQRNSSCVSINVADPCSDLSDNGCWRVEVVERADLSLATTSLVGQLDDCLGYLAFNIGWESGYSSFQYCADESRSATVRRSKESSLSRGQWSEHNLPPRALPPVKITEIVAEALQQCTADQHQLELERMERLHREELDRERQRARDQERRSSW